MGGSIELIPLLCVKCSTPVPANPDEVAWVCAQCSQAMRLDEVDGLKPVDIYYSAAVGQGKRGRPFWVVTGKVALNRSTYSGNKKGDADVFWSQPRTFFIPAFSCQLDTILQTGTQSLTNPPACVEGPALPFEPVVLSLEDVRAAVEFIIVAVEAERKDKVKEIQMALDLSTPVLWVLP